MEGYRKSFEVVREIGKGGMGVVFLARRRGSDRPVALKVLAPRVRSDQTSLRRFRREALLVAKLDHPNVVRLLDHDLSAEEPYLVFEHIDGASTLTRMLHGAAAAPPELAVRLAIAAQIVDGLAHIHERGIIHRDLKAGNVLIDRSGSARIIDLGLSRAVDPEHSALTQRGQVIGTCVYMSPEQILGEEASLRSDVYALGLLLYELALGRLVFSSAARSQITPRQRLAPAGIPALSEQAPAVSRALNDLVMRCLSLQPEDRPTDAGQVRQELSQIVGPAGPGPVETGPRWWPWPRPAASRLWSYGLLVSLVALALVAAVWSGLAGKERPSSPAVETAGPGR